MLQPRSTSALFREMYPEHYDQSGVTRRLDEVSNRIELVMITTAQLQHIMLTRFGAKPGRYPTSFDDLVVHASPKSSFTEFTDDEIAASFAEIDARMGWTEGG